MPGPCFAITSRGVTHPQLTRMLDFEPDPDPKPDTNLTLILTR